MSSSSHCRGIPRSGAALATVALGLWLSGAAASEPAAETLSFAQALSIAEREAPPLVAGDAAIDAAEHAVGPADAFPDPKASIGATAVPIEGDERLEFDSEPMTMQMIGITQTVPSRAKRKARLALAFADVERARSERDVSRARVLRETAAAWIEVYHAERGLALFDQWERESRLLIDVVTALVESGRTRGSDALLARRELLTVADLRDRQIARVAAARARLRTWVGPAAGSRLSGEPPDFKLSAQHLHSRLQQHPELEAYASLAAQAQAQVGAAEAAKRPDWEVELGYQRREAFGDMMALRVTVDLPLFAHRRQDPLIASAHRRADQVAAERAAALREHHAMLEAGLADYRRLQSEARRLSEETLPLMEELVDLRLAEYRSGEGDLTDLVQSRQALIETRLDLVDTRSAEGQLAAELRYAYLEDEQ